MVRNAGLADTLFRFYLGLEAGRGSTVDVKPESRISWDTIFPMIHRTVTSNEIHQTIGHSSLISFMLPCPQSQSHHSRSSSELPPSQAILLYTPSIPYSSCRPLSVGALPISILPSSGPRLPVLSSANVIALRCRLVGVLVPEPERSGLCILLGTADAGPPDPSP